MVPRFTNSDLGLNGNPEISGNAHGHTGASTNDATPVAPSDTVAHSMFDEPMADGPYTIY